MEILKPFVDFVLRDSGYILSFIVGCVIGVLMAVFAWRFFRSEYVHRNESLKSHLADQREENETLRRRLAIYQDEIDQIKPQYNQLELTVKALRERARELESQSSDMPSPVVVPSTIAGNKTKSQDWNGMTEKLLATGINITDIEMLRCAIERREIGIIDSDGRNRIRIREGGAKKIPVAILWRGKQNYRVLIPEGTDELAKVVELSEV